MPSASLLVVPLRPWGEAQQSWKCSGWSKKGMGIQQVQSTF